MRSLPLPAGRAGRWPSARLVRSMIKPGERVLYYLQDGPSQSFGGKELLAVQSDTQLPADGVLRR